MIRSNSRCQVPFDPERKLGGRGNVRKYYANLIIRQSWRRVGRGEEKKQAYIKSLLTSGNNGFEGFPIGREGWGGSRVPRCPVLSKLAVGRNWGERAG